MQEPKYLQSYTGDIFKVLPTHYLKISPWKDREDRRVKELDADKCTILTYKNACMIVNKQFDEAIEEWSHNGIEYKSDPITCTDPSQYASLLSLLPSHKVIQKSSDILKISKDDTTLSLQSGPIEMKMVKHKGKIYYCMIVDKYLPRVQMYNMFGEFLQWANIKHVKPIYSKTNKQYI